jgi:hypothetical protein
LTEGSRKLLKIVGFQLAKKNKKGGQGKHKKGFPTLEINFCIYSFNPGMLTHGRACLSRLYLKPDFSKQRGHSLMDIFIFFY